MDMTYLQEPPKLNESEILDSVQEHYGLQGTLHALVGDRDQNFLLESPGDQRHVVKISSLNEAQEILEFETEMMIRLSRDTSGLTPNIVSATSGSSLITLQNDNMIFFQLNV